MNNHQSTPNPLSPTAEACGRLRATGNLQPKVLGALALLCLLSLSLPACSSLSQPYPAKDFFTVDPGVPDDTTAAPAINGVLRVEHVRIAEPYRDVAFTYRTGPTTMRQDFYNAFIAPPEDIFTSTATEWIARSKIATAAVDRGSVVDSVYTADIAISDLYGDFTPGQTPKAVLTGHCFILDDSGTTRKILRRINFHREIPLKSPDATGLSVAYDQAWRECLIELVQSLRDGK